MLGNCSLGSQGFGFSNSRFVVSYYDLLFKVGQLNRFLQIWSLSVVVREIRCFNRRRPIKSAAAALQPPCDHAQEALIPFLPHPWNVKRNDTGFWHCSVLIMEQKLWEVKYKLGRCVAF